MAEFKSKPFLSIGSDSGSADRCLRDMVALSTLPAMWLGADPLRIAESLASSLFTTLNPEFVYVSFTDGPGRPPIAVAQTDRYGTSAQIADRVGAPIFERARAHDPDDLLMLSNPLGAGFLRVAVRPLGPHAELGVIAAAFAEDDQPMPVHRLMLNVSASQASTAVQSARLLRALRESEERNRRINTDLLRHVSDLEKANADARDARRAALNLMENEVQSRQRAESLNRELRREITERKEAEEALAEQQRLLKSVTDNASVSLFITDERQHCVFMNPAAERLTGFTLEQVRGRSLHDLVHHTRPDGRPYPLEACPIDQAFPTDNRMQGEETFIHPSGRFYDVAFTVSPIPGPTGRPIGTIVEVQDITERKALQERLRLFAKELEAQVEDRTRDLLQSQDRLRAMATDLNLAEQRERKRLAMELHDHLQQNLVLGRLTLGQGRRAAAAVPACLDVLNKIDDIFAESLSYTRTLVADLSPPVLRDHGLPAGLKWLGEYMKKHQITVTVAVPEKDDLQLPEDQAVLLFQSARELLINSAKHAGTRHAEVRLERNDGHLQIMVRDRGAGFDLAAATAVGTPHGGISSKFGLFSIQERMRALGGSFDIQSAPGHGTTATLVLPLQQRHEAKVLTQAQDQEVILPSALSLTSASRSFASRPASPRIRVLLVDDHTVLRQGLRSIVTAYDHFEVVGEAGDGVEAVQLAQRLDPDVVVMDINMPRMDGIEATQRIKTNQPTIVVIGLSVNQSADTEYKMKAAGASAYLTKESAVDALCQAIEEAVSYQTRLVSL